MARRAAVGPILLAALLAAGAAHASSWSQTRYGTREGLPSPFVKGAAEDAAGFVWLATDGGLVRFDGSTFTSFLDAPSGRFVKAVTALADGRVLVAGDSGLSVVRPGGGRTRVELLVAGADSPGQDGLYYPKSLLVDSRGRIWVAETGSVALLLEGSRFERFGFPPRARAAGYVRSFSIAEDGRGRIWAAAHSGELFGFDESRRRFDPVPLPAGAPEPTGTNHLAAVAPDVLWQAADAGLVELRLAPDRRAVVASRRLGAMGAPSFVHPLGADVLVTGYGEPARRVPLAAASAGAAFSSTAIAHHVAVTRSGDLYLSTDDGLLVLRRQPFEPLSPPGLSGLQSLAAGPGGALYACDRRSVYRLERARGAIRARRLLDVPGPPLVGLLGDGRRIAAAALGRLLLIENGRVARSLDLRDRGSYAVALASGPDGSIWFSQFDAPGALRLRPDGALQPYGEEHGLGSRIATLRAAPDGTLYAAGAARSRYLFRYDPRRDRFDNLSRPLAFSSSEPFAVYDLAFDPAGRLWLASTAGLLEQHGDRLSRVDLGPDLTGLPAHSLATSADGRLWAASSAGLVAFDPDRHAYETYDESAGLPARSIAYHTLFAGAGEIVVATSRGAARAAVAELASHPPGPPLFVELRANGRELDLETAPARELPHGSWIAARAASPGGAGRVFQWKIEPADAAWRPASERADAVLPTSGSGPQRLLVRAATRGTNAWGPAAELRLRVAPAWYQRWWALGALAAVVAGGFGGGVLLARARSRRNERRLSRVVEERTRALLRANDLLAAKNAELERFTYTVSHDLKSPLVTIRGFLGFLEPAARAGDFERLRADLSRVGQAAERMVLLLDQLLELSRVGRLRRPAHRVAFAALVEEAARLAAGPLASRGAELAVEEGLPMVVGDRVRLVELLQNLLENAAKFSLPGERPRIAVGVRPGPEGPVFFVRDQGIGIDPAHQERVFDVFEQLDPGSEGTGLGLAIARRIVETHGGRIWVESEGRGRGAAFCFTLPGSGDPGERGSVDDPQHPQA